MLWRYRPGIAGFRFRRATVSASELIGRLSARFRIEDLSVREPAIEDTVRRIYEDGLLRGELAEYTDRAAVLGHATSAATRGSQAGMSTGAGLGPGG